VAPFHRLTENPTLSLQRDFESMELLDRLGFDEAWIGEHHSAGLEFISSPEIFIAEAGARTRRIRFGTGVVSLPYHHPYMVAERIVQLDHQLRGRLMFGVGAGSLASDVYTLGLESTEIRAMTDEALGVVLRLLRGEAVSYENDRYTLREARCQLRPFQRPHPEVSIAATGTPSGPRAAGKHGISVLTLGLGAKLGSTDFLTDQWRHWSEACAEQGTVPDRSRWRIASPVHIAETRDQALKDARYGIADWMKYMRLSPVWFAYSAYDANTSPDEMVEAMVETGHAIIGSPDDLIEHIEQLWERTGGFGAWLDMVPNWADFAQRQRCYELIADRVIPHFKALNAGLDESFEWVSRRIKQIRASRTEGVEHENRKWEEKTAKAADSFA
jgi:limonene 1,2-monooxygenase